MSEAIDRMRWKRSAYRFAAEAIDRALIERPWVNDPAWVAVELEARKMMNGLRAAGMIVDDPEVVEHASGDGKAP